MPLSISLGLSDIKRAEPLVQEFTFEGHVLEAKSVVYDSSTGPYWRTQVSGRGAGKELCERAMDAYAAWLAGAR